MIPALHHLPQERADGELHLPGRDSLQPDSPGLRLAAQRRLQIASLVLRSQASNTAESSSVLRCQVVFAGDGSLALRCQAIITASAYCQPIFSEHSSLVLRYPAPITCISVPQHFSNFKSCAA